MACEALLASNVGSLLGLSFSRCQAACLAKSAYHGRQLAVPRQVTLQTRQQSRQRLGGIKKSSPPRRSLRQVAAAAGPGGREDEADEPRKKSIFEFVTDNPSSRGAIQMENTPAEDNNMGEMISRIEGKGRDFGRLVRSGSFIHFVRETGKKTDPLILFLHGVPTQSYSFRLVMPQFSEKGYRCIAPDAIGFGLSEKPQPEYDYAYTEEAYHEQLDQLLDTLEVDAPFYLVVQGLVLGSYALSWALQHPERLIKLAVLNTQLSTKAIFLPSVFYQLRMPLVGEFVSQNAILAERFIEAGSPYVVESDDADVYRLPYLNSSDAGFALLATLRKYNPQVSASQFEAGFKPDKWTTPTHVAWGVNDKHLAQVNAEAFRLMNPEHITTSMLEGAGHLPQEDWPEKVVDSLHAFFRRSS
eukprot:jgi/Mesen1/4102/ME000216S03355